MKALLDTIQKEKSLPSTMVKTSRMFVDSSSGGGGGGVRSVRGAALAAEVGGSEPGPHHGEH